MNCKKEFEAFQKEWAEQEKIYRAEGVDPEVIKEIYDYEHRMFNERRREASHGFYTDIESLPLISNNTPEDDVLERIESPELYVAIKSLKPIERKILIESVVDDKTHDEIAVEIGVKRVTVTMRLERIMKKLRNAMGKE